MFIKYFIQEEDDEGIQMTTMIQQGTPGPVKQNFLNCDFDDFLPTTFCSLEKQTTLKDFFYNFQEKQKEDSSMTASPNSLVSSQVNESE